MIPISDGLPTRCFPIVTILLLGANVVVFVLQMLLMSASGQEALNQAIFAFGVVPARVAADFGPATWLTFVTAMFLHGGVMHIAGNMLYLWIFGNNVEDVMGHFWFTLFYLASGFAASAAQVLASWGSNVPGIGASGAIAGVLAAYLLFFPRARVQTLLILGYFARVRALPAIVVLGLWFVLQLFNGVLSFGASETGGVAWFAHIGGFVAGLILALPWIGKARQIQWRVRYR
ncbi:MAG: rhomboid family intramembrane serine protease [Chloroflexi bacterium]|nr:rhomboid family intramembrane serine protease [Chloroflexota bacterium]